MAEHQEIGEHFMDMMKIAACSKASCGAAKCAEGKEKVRQRIRSLKADRPVKDQEQTKTAGALDYAPAQVVEGDVERVGRVVGPGVMDKWRERTQRINDNMKANGGDWRAAIQKADSTPLTGKPAVPRRPQFDPKRIKELINRSQLMRPTLSPAVPLGPGLIEKYRKAMGKKASLDYRYLYGMPKRASERKAEFKNKLSMYFKEVAGN